MKRFAVAFAAVAILFGGAAGCKAESAYELKLLLPDNYSSATAWPLVVFLHGASPFQRDRARSEKPAADELLAHRQPFVLLAPHCPDGPWDAARLRATIDQVTAEHAIDRRRVYVTGQSLGGAGTWDFARRYPDLVAAIVPLAAGGEPVAGCELAGVPVWAFHGEADDVVPAAVTKANIAALERCGAAPRATYLPGAGHQIEKLVYARDELFDWLLAQRSQAR